MKLSNPTGYAGEFVPLVGADGSMNAVVIIKGTFSLSQGNLVLASRQQDIAYADILVETVNGPKPVYDSDLVDRKPKADFVISRPSADVLERRSGEPVRVALGSRRFDGIFDEEWRLGAVARDHSDRQQYAGTYDDAWQRERMPLLPADFDRRYHQSARPEQTVESFDPGERIAVQGLYSPDEVVTFTLPTYFPVAAGAVAGQRAVSSLMLDTVCLSGIAPLVILTWRRALACPRSLEDVSDHSVAMVLPNQDTLALVS